MGGISGTSPTAWIDLKIVIHVLHRVGKHWVYSYFPYHQPFAHARPLPTGPLDQSSRGYNQVCISASRTIQKEFDVACLSHVAPLPIQHTKMALSTQV